MAHKFKYIPMSEEDLIESAIDRLMRNETVCDFTATDMLQESAEEVYNIANDYYYKQGKRDENLVYLTNEAVIEFDAYLIANPSARRDIIEEQVNALFYNGTLLLASEDYDMQRGQYDDYCCGL